MTLCLRVFLNAISRQICIWACVCHQVKWRKPVVPGDVLVMEMELLKWKPKFGLAKMTGKAYVDGVLALDVKEFTFALAQGS